MSTESSSKGKRTDLGEDLFGDFQPILTSANAEISNEIVEREIVNEKINFYCSRLVEAATRAQTAAEFNTKTLEFIKNSTSKLTPKSLSTKIVERVDNLLANQAYHIRFLEGIQKTTQKITEIAVTKK